MKKREKNRVNKKQKLYIIIASSLAIIVIVTSGIYGWFKVAK